MKIENKFTLFIALMLVCLFGWLFQSLNFSFGNVVAFLFFST
jgi:hypothetical protein